MTKEEKELAERELKDLLLKLEERKNSFAILDVDVVNGKGWKPPIAKQAELFNDFQNRLSTPLDERLRYLLYYGGNGAGKTFIWAYVCVLLALWMDTKKYGLPFIGTKKSIWIATKSGNNVKTTIDRYLLQKGSPTRIPTEMIESKKVDNGILKQIILTNWCVIYVNTYDQGSDNLQGWEPDFLWMDEEPTNEDVWTELLFRTRNKGCETLITMTPLSGLTPIYKYFFEQQDQDVRNKSRIYHVSAMDNPHTDKTLTKGLTDEMYRLRVEGSFENPTWLVYNEFFRSRNVVPHFDPWRLGQRDEIKFYRGIDFGVSHPTACVWVAQDQDDNLYIFDELEESNMLLSSIVDKVNQKSIWFPIEFTVRDSASSREGMEVAKLWLKTIPADKNTKWVNEMSNRRSWILLINDLFNKGKLLISDRCVKLIKELETHFYKEGGKKDWEVNKERDDLLDALRYLIFLIRKNNSINKKSILVREVEKKYASNSGLRGF